MTPDDHGTARHGRRRGAPRDIREEHERILRRQAAQAFETGDHPRGRFRDDSAPAGVACDAAPGIAEETSPDAAWITDPEPPTPLIAPSAASSDGDDPWLSEAEPSAEITGIEWTPDEATDDEDAAALPTREAAEAPEPIPRTEPRTPHDPRRHRSELQGLRAVAILMVVCYHIWFGRVSGGVDIFLMVSAFLLTGSFLRKLEAGAPLEVGRYWLRAFRRLVPPAAVVIALTTVAGLIALPVSRSRSLLDEAVASALYAENWLLAARSVDYYAADHASASPLQHFWSLAIQGQIFVIWPLLMLVVALVVRRARVRPHRAAAWLFGAIAATSLAYSVVRTQADQAFTYFDTGARLWEFAVGSLLALGLPLLERHRTDAPSAARAVFSWAGLVLILACGWAVDVAGAFPGYIALWPLLAACLVLACGRTGTRWGADRLLSSAPLQWLGGISYALYLVHWPLLVIGLAISREHSADLALGGIIIALSVMTAWAVTTYVDTPVRRSTWIGARSWRSAAAVLSGWALVLGTVATAGGVLDQQAEEVRARAAAADAEPYPGAAVLLPGRSGSPTPSDGNGPALPPIPLLTELDGDWIPWRGDCPASMSGLEGELAEYCTVVETGAAPDAPLVVVAGNSHALQAQPMLQELAREKGWRLVSVARPQCTFGETSGQWCAQYNREVVAMLRQNHAAALITNSTFAGVPGGRAEQPAEGFMPLAAQVLDSGIPILAMRDVPRLDQDFVACVENGGDCASPVALSLSDRDLAASVADELNARPDAAPGSAVISSIDLTRYICPDGVCVPVVGNVRTYMDDNHLTASYARTLGAALELRLPATGFAPATPVPGPSGSGDASDGGDGAT